MRRFGALLFSVAMFLVGTSAAWAYVYGPTPMAVAVATAKKFAAHEVKAINQPQVSYTFGECHLLHRRPWVAYNCTFEVHGWGACHGIVTVGVKRLADRKYRGQEVTSRYLDTQGC